MKNYFIVILCLVFSNAPLAVASDFTKEEVIEFLKKTYPQEKGDISVEYFSKDDYWCFLFHVKTPGPRIPGMELNGVIKDDKKNPKITVFMEG